MSMGSLSLSLAADQAAREASCGRSEGRWRAEDEEAPPLPPRAEQRVWTMTSERWGGICNSDGGEVSEERRGSALQVG